MLAATVFEAFGDAVVRVALRDSSGPARVGLFLLGGTLLTLYGTSLNLAPVDFAAVTGLYVAMVFVMFQIVNYSMFRIAPSAGVLVGGSLIVAGGLIATIWK